jgi:hypothetical protein
MTTQVDRNIYKRGPYQFQVKIRRNGENINQTFETLAQARKFRDVTLGKVLAHDYRDTTKERRTILRALLERYETEVTPKKRGKRQEVTISARSPSGSRSLRARSASLDRSLDYSRRLWRMVAQAQCPLRD